MCNKTMIRSVLRQLMKKYPKLREENGTLNEREFATMMPGTLENVCLSFQNCGIKKTAAVLALHRKIKKRQLL